MKGRARRTRYGTWSVPGVLVFIMLVWTVPAGAVTVVIVRLHNSPVVTKETLVRVALELRSVGFETEIVDAPAAGDEDALAAAPWLSPEGASNRADALLALVGEGTPVAVEVRAIDRRTGRSVVHRMPLEGTSERTPETLAIRAMELLRSSLIELDLMPALARDDPMAQPAVASVPSATISAPGVAVERFADEVGVAALVGTGGVGPAALPVLHLDVALGSSLLVRTTAAGLGTRGTVEASTGTAQVAEEQILLGAVYRFAGERLRPFVALSAGALHLSVEGWADPPSQGRRPGRWSFLLDGGLGAALGLRDRFYVAAAANVQVAEPYVAIRFLDAAVATAARPNLLFALTVGAWL